MTPVRTPDVVRDIPGLLTYGMPVTFTAEGLDGERIECTGVVLDTPEPNTTWRVANLTDGIPADLYGDETRDMCPDWSSPLAIYACLHWLADRGHPACLWMLPSTHGGRVEAWADLTAWEVSAIVVARSVLRVARGLGPVKHLLSAYGPEELVGLAGLEPHQTRRVIGGARRIGAQRVVSVGPHGWFYDCAVLPQGASVQHDDRERGPETGDAGKLAADRAALADGCAALAPGGILLPD